ncbi:hypothetical protein ACIGMX_12660 [Streptomyces aquilus]|uniref:hypothetical protein n=1 Tax=Streptomyces aquilus TaxID=2548456 RepID=UPI0037D29F6D
MRRDVRLEIITEAIEGLIPGAAPANLSVEVKETLSVTGCASNTWTSRPEGLAERIFTALYGRPRPPAGELDARMSAGADLESRPWYPLRPGDLVHVHYEQAADMPAFGETYIVGDAGGPGDPVPRLLSMQLLAHTCPDAIGAGLGMVGCFAVDAHDDPLHEPWYEAGPQRLTIVRDGRPVHAGGAR